MNNADVANPEFPLNRSEENYKEIARLLGDMDVLLRQVMLEKGELLPTITIKKGELGKISGQVRYNEGDEISVKPTVAIKADSGVTELNWLVKNCSARERMVPEIFEEVVTGDGMERYKGQLPKFYKHIKAEEKAWVFKDINGKALGWAVINDKGNTCGLGFMGVAEPEEGKGVGTSIIRWLQERYTKINLTVCADETPKRDQQKNRERLDKFYMSNGFYNVNNWIMSWDKGLANLESEKEINIGNSVVAQGTIYYNGDVLEAYLNKIKSNRLYKKLFSENEQMLIDSWMSFRGEVRAEDAELELVKQEF